MQTKLPRDLIPGVDRLPVYGMFGEPLGFELVIQASSDLVLTMSGWLTVDPLAPVEVAE